MAQAPPGSPRPKPEATAAREADEAGSAAGDGARLSVDLEQPLPSARPIEPTSSLRPAEVPPREPEAEGPSADAERRRRELQSILADTREGFARRRRARTIRLVVAGLSLLAALGLAARLVPILATGITGTSSELDRLSAPFLAAGFTVERTVWGTNPTEVPAQRDLCYVVVAASSGAPARVRLDRGFAVLEANESLGFCTCTGEPPRLRAVGDEPIAMRVLSASAGAVGGADLLAQHEPRPAAVAPETIDRACAEAAIDEWLATRSAPEPPRELTEVEEKLRSLGMRPVASAPERQRFCTVPPADATCFLGLSREPSDSLSLRIAGGTRALDGQRSAIAFCTNKAAPTSLWRTGSGALTVLSVPAQRVGGLVGMRDLAARAGLETAAWVAPENQAYDAAATLGASAISPSLFLEDADAGIAAASIFAFSTGATSTLTIEPTARSIVCRPGVSVGASQAVCVVSAPGAWRPVGNLPAGSLAARRPSWFPPIGSDRAQLERLLDVMEFARRMSLAGFDHAFTGVTETATGARITGRSGEKEIVAVAIGSAPPYVHTLSDAEPWSLHDAPRIVPIKPGQTVELTASPRYAGGAREIVVWRR